jgi:hypothetical protein
MTAVVDATAMAGYEPEPYQPDADETVECPNCQKMNSPDARFCDQCGFKLEGSPDVNAEGETEDLGGKPNKGTAADKRLKENQEKSKHTPNSVIDAPEAAAADEGPPVMQIAPMWRGPLCVEGQVTGDGREFAKDSLTWADPPLPLRWQYEDSHGGTPMNKTVQVGSIQRVWREGDLIMGEGIFDLGGADDDLAHEAYRRNQAGALTGISIDADDITDADVEYIFKEPEGEEVDEDDIILLLFAAPEKIIFHAGRVRAATLCDIPAFVEAKIEPIPEDERPAALVASIEAVAATFSAVGTHSTTTSDATWDGAANEARLPSPMPVATARAAYAWLDTDQVTDGECPKAAGKFIHHMVGSDGEPGAANLTACSTGIGVLNGGRGGTTIPDADVRGVYNHLAKHLRDAGREPPELNATAEVLTASSWQDQLWRPPAEWFTDPKLGQYVPIMVTDAGRVYGHAAAWGQCHLGFTNECVMPPAEDYHSHFLTGEIPVANGTTVAVGQITAGIEHADLHLSASQAKDHYENTDACVADVVVGNDAHGIWVAGAIRPWANAARVHSLRASGQVSPDWRRIGGVLRMVAMLAVNTSGYQAPRARSLVASGHVQALISSGIAPMQGVGRTGPNDEELRRRAMLLLRQEAYAKVHPDGGH